MLSDRPTVGRLTGSHDLLRDAMATTRGVVGDAQGAALHAPSAVRSATVDAARDGRAAVRRPTVGTVRFGIVRREGG